jgi:transposase
VDVTEQELIGLLERAKAVLSEADYLLFEKIVKSITHLSELLQNRELTLHTLRRMLFNGFESEKTAKVMEAAGQAVQPKEGGGERAKQKEERQKEPRRGHGRNGAESYEGAEQVYVPHPTLKHMDPCPRCGKGSALYRQKKPKVLVRVRGQAPIHATVMRFETLRCSICQEVFVAPVPEKIGDEKYDASSMAMVPLLKYGCGFPFYRLAGLQAGMKIPLPYSTQWDIVNEGSKKVEAVYEELIRQAAQGERVHNDDTPMKILALLKRTEEGERGDGMELEGSPEESVRKEAKERTGVFTTGIVSETKEGLRIALFFTGRRHAGENLDEVLKRRAKELGPPQLMCDGLSRNVPETFRVILGNCLAHARRRFVDKVAQFPNECFRVIRVLGRVYGYDEQARRKQMTPQERLSFHQAKSGRLMKALKAWCEGKFERREVEPNSGLGQAMRYLMRHWEKLTLFLREPGAVLDNNICERALKKAILNRKNAYFYKTEKGARVGDIFMTLIHTAELCKANVFEYLTTILSHFAAVALRPGEWLPWNYQETLAKEKAGTVVSSGGAVAPSNPSGASLEAPPTGGRGPPRQ